LKVRVTRLDAKEFKGRTKKFALRVIKMVESLPNDRAADVLGKQLLRSGTSVASNYRAACRAKSKAGRSINSASLKKKPMKVCCGWNYWLSLTLSKRRV
jgi:hypothetical protein